MFDRKEYCKNKYHENEEHREYIKNKSKEWNKNNKDRVNAGVKRRRMEAREKLLDYLGRKCVICGYNDVRALVFDHINNDGHIHRKKHGNTSNEYIRYSKDLEYAKTIIQVLCANCNTIKEFNRKV